MMEDFTVERLTRVLQLHFGLSTFRPCQYDAIHATLLRQDSLVILPTGAGKSLCFQFPPFHKDHAFTVVVSPLIALAKDQVEKCEERNIEAERWNCEVPEARKARIASELAGDEPSIRLLYTTPESLQQPKLRDALKEAAAHGTLCSFAIDEAHCVSEWGHDFRPAYLDLALLKQDFPGVPIAAFTASCTRKVEGDMMVVLKLRDPVIIKSSFNRPNIQYEVRHKELIGDGTEAATLDDLVAFIQQRPGQCGIIYARLRSTCDWLARSLCAHELDVGCYHAGRPADQRNRTQRDWSGGATAIVVATIAFGMGIDRADVRWVVHWNAPTSMEGLYQESGRAGRDGLPSLSLLYSSRSDLEANQKMERGSRAGAVAQVAEYCLHAGCRRKAVLKYFGEARAGCDGSQQEQACDWCCDKLAVQRQLQQLDRHAQQGNKAAAVRAAMAGGGAGSQDANAAEAPALKRPGWAKAAARCSQLQPVQQQPTAPADGASADEEAAGDDACCEAGPPGPVDQGGRQQPQQQRRPQQPLQGGLPSKALARPLIRPAVKRPRVGEAHAAAEGAQPSDDDTAQPLLVRPCRPRDQPAQGCSASAPSYGSEARAEGDGGAPFGMQTAAHAPSAAAAAAAPPPPVFPAFKQPRVALRPAFGRNAAPGALSGGAASAAGPQPKENAAPAEAGLGSSAALDPADDRSCCKPGDGGGDSPGGAAGVPAPAAPPRACGGGPASWQAASAASSVVLLKRRGGFKPPTMRSVK